MWGSRELNVVTPIFQTALTQHGGHDKRERNQRALMSQLIHGLGHEMTQVFLVYYSV